MMCDDYEYKLDKSQIMLYHKQSVKLALEVQKFLVELLHATETTAQATHRLFI